MQHLLSWQVVKLYRLKIVAFYIKAWPLSLPYGGIKVKKKHAGLSLVTCQVDTINSDP
jgi:hypothetical protein